MGYILLGENPLMIDQYVVFAIVFSRFFSLLVFSMRNKFSCDANRWIWTCKRKLPLYYCRIASIHGLTPMIGEHSMKDSVYSTDDSYFDWRRVKIKNIVLERKKEKSSEFRIFWAINNNSIWNVALMYHFTLQLIYYFMLYIILLNWSMVQNIFHSNNWRVSNTFHLLLA